MLAQSGHRYEDAALLTGRGRYVADLVPGDALWCSFARSPIAHGTLLSVETAAALAVPGVVGVHTAADLGLPDIPGQTGRGPEAPAMTRPPLARDTLRYVGEPYAVVVAESAGAAEDGVHAVFADLDFLEPVVTAADAIAGATHLFPDHHDGNVVARELLDVGTAPDVELVSATVRVDHARLAPTPIESLAVLAMPTGDGGLHVTISHQAPHRVRDQLAGLLSLEKDAIRVTTPDVGGAFGMKGMLFPEYPVVAQLALLHGRPVAWIQPRREHFTGGTHGRSHHQEVTLRADRAGRIHAAEMTLVSDVGAYPHNGSQIGGFTRLVATGLYAIPRLAFDWTVVVTNTAPTGSYRGAGRPEAALAIERAIDELARALDMDPAEVRLKNFIADLPHTTPTGAKYDSGDYAAALTRALEVVDYAGVRDEQRRRRSEGGRPLGIGIGAFIERAGGAPTSPEYGAVSVDEDGIVTVRTGSTSAGQGHETVWRRIAARVFDVPTERVRFVAGDTAEVAAGVGSFASRSAQIGGSAVLRTATTVRERARELAASLLEARVSDLLLRDGVFHVAGVPDATVTLGEAAAAASAEGEPLASEEMYSPGAQTFPYGVHIAVVEVDEETGLVTLLRLVAVDDVGTVLDEVLVEGQLHGSLAQGVGASLTEEMVYDESGQPLTTTFMDYLIPNAGLELHLTSERLEHPAPSNPLGAKGAGEGGCIGAPPAILNATLDALAPHGVRELQLPLRPQRVWQALRDARS